VNEFIDLLKGAQIALLVDVRSVPRSRTNPQYNCDILPETLAPSAIRYEHMAALGGLRARQDVPADVNAFWQNQSFHNFADYALTPAFGPKGPAQPGCSCRGQLARRSGFTAFSPKRACQ
jgi:uncharacterized protein (DUF488 family)